MVGSKPSAGAAPLVGVVLGKYRLDRLLGEGGMAAVYEATHQELGRRAAVKTLHQRYATSTEVRERFLREGQSAARIRHPHVVDVYDVGFDGAHPYLVMELLDGEDLGRLLAREGPLSVERTSDLMVPVLAAVIAAHDIKVVHRDLKPDNIFLALERGKLKPKVLDFGISKLVDDEDAKALTGTGALLGTPYYMSPEQARGAKKVDSRSDQYSLGVILYQCVTARRPVEEPSLYSLIQRIVNGDFAPPRQLNPSLSSAFEAVILRAMAHDPKERFTTTRAFGRALLQFASDNVRALYQEEIESDPDRVTVHSTPPGDTEATGLGTTLTTLGESALHRDLRPAPPPNRYRRAALWVALPLAATAGLWITLKPPTTHTPAAASGVVAPSAFVEPSGDVPSKKGTPSPPAPKQLVKTLRSDPPGATVWVEGKVIGVTPLPLEFPEGASVHVELTLPDHEPRQLDVSASDPDDLAVELAQTPIARKKPGVPKPHAKPPSVSPANGPILAPDRPALAPR